MQVPEQCQSPFHESANRAHLLVGCDPTAIFVLVVLCVVLGFSVPTWWGILGDVLIFLFVREVLQQMAMVDPLMFKVHFNKQIYNQGVWTAKSLRPLRWRSR